MDIGLVRGWRGGPVGRVGARPLAVAAAVTALAAGVVMPGSVATAGASSSPVVVAAVAPFTGADAAIGPKNETACYAAAQEINQAGGVLGHQIACKTVDTRGDPADAVPAVRQMYATTPNLSLVIGCTSDEASTVVPIFAAHATVSFCMTGESEFDAVHYKYFFRPVPPDAAESAAMALIAKNKGYQKVALAFGNDAGSQTFVAPALAALKKENIRVVSNQTLDINSTTFETEAQAIVSAHPDAIIMETLGAAGVALINEIYQLNGNKMIPIVGTANMIDPTVFSGVTSGPVGVKNFIANFVTDNQSVSISGPAYPLFKKMVLAQAGKIHGVGNIATLVSSAGTVHEYDAINLSALAMTMANSTVGSKFRADILAIAKGGPGTVTVTTYAAGVKALKAHKKIHYVGVAGAYHFDPFQTAYGLFVQDKYLANGTTVTVGKPLGYCNLTACLSKISG
jgi:ABC-type branched-subunit amino acid transport system substrate-binding protein